METLPGLGQAMWGLNPDKGARREGPWKAEVCCVGLVTCGGEAKGGSRF